MKIFLVRHGEVFPNVSNEFSTQDDDLTEKGIRQAEELRKKLKNIHFDKVISSPYLRATHTEYILTDYDNEIITDNRLRERSLGNLDGQEKSSIDREEYWDYYRDIKIGITEDIRDFFDRVFDFINELKTYNYENVLIVAHSGVSKAFSAYFDGILDGKFLHRGLKTNCDMIVYELK